MARYPSIVTKSQAALTVDRPILGKHPLWRPGCKFFVDFCDTFGANPLADGAITTGATMTDLLHTPNTLTISSTVLSNAAGKAGVVSAGGAGTISIGGAGDCDIPVTHAFLWNFWLKHPASGFNGSAFVPLAYIASGSPSNGNAAQMFIDSGSNGQTFRMQVGTGAAVRNLQLASAAAAGAPTLMSLYYDPATGTQTIYKNGVAVNNAVHGALNLLDGSAMTARIDTRFIGTLYGTSLFDITEALETEADQGITSLTILQHLEAEYAFGIGTLTGSPRVAYA